MRLLITSATSLEIAPLLAFLEDSWYPIAPFHFQQGDIEIKVLITGIGSANMAASTGLMVGRNGFDLAINAGIAGAFDKSLAIGEVVNVVSEQFGDLGIEEADGIFRDVFDMELVDVNQFPLTLKKLINPHTEEFSFLKKVNGLTVNKVHGHPESIRMVTEKYRADVESMEGAGFFTACLMADVNFLEIRSISNYVEKRNKNNWSIPLAVTNLNEVLIQILQSFKG